MVRIAKKTLIIGLFFLCPFFLYCAKEGMPPGGPEDTTPPQVISVWPGPRSTEVDLDSRIEITFSERMTAKLTEESIFVSPLPKKPFDLKWRGTKLTLTPQAPLQSERTYVISIGTGAQDLRRNRLSQSYSFAFSTGSGLDEGKISGEVWAKQTLGLAREMGISVWAYLLSGDKIKVDPEKEKPDYVTQTDNEGRYVLENLTLGRYRLFAVQDANRDLSWSWESESMGVTTGDVELTESSDSATDVDFILDRKDKRSPSLLRCYSVNRNLIKLEFDEELEGRSVLNRGNFGIRAVPTRDSLEVVSVYFQDKDSRRVFLLTERMNPGEKYELDISGLTDKTGNFLDTASKVCAFDGAELADTSGPQLTQTLPKDEQIEVAFDTKIELIFDEAPDEQSVESAFSLVDSNGLEVKGKGGWETPNRFVFSPDSLLPGNMRYQIELLGKRVSDLLGNSSLADSSFTSTFVTVDPANLGAISGSVQITGEELTKTIVLTLWPLEQGRQPYGISLSGQNSFKFQWVLPGKYFLGGFVDLDENGTLSAGHPHPFAPLEPFTVYPDTIQVRSRWETERVDLVFR